MTISTGMKSAVLCGSHNIALNIPFPAAANIPVKEFTQIKKNLKWINIPVGPFQLSTHPFNGPCILLKTILGLTMTSGKSPLFSFNQLSANAFVNV